MYWERGGYFREVVVRKDDRQRIYTSHSYTRSLWKDTRSLNVYHCIRHLSQFSLYHRCCCRCIGMHLNCNTDLDEYITTHLSRKEELRDIDHSLHHTILSQSIRVCGIYWCDDLGRRLYVGTSETDHVALFF